MAKPVWHMVKQAARVAGIARPTPHNLRRSCARQCQSDGRELEQIQLLLGHLSVQTPNAIWAPSSAFVPLQGDRMQVNPKELKRVLQW